MSGTYKISSTAGLHALAALYDSYDKKRFPSDCVILLNDLPENQSMEEFLQHISTFAGKMLIIQFTEENKKIIYEQLSALYNKVDFIHSISLIIAYDRNNTDNKWNILLLFYEIILVKNEEFNLNLEFVLNMSEILNRQLKYDLDLLDIDNINSIINIERIGYFQNFI